VCVTNGSQVLNYVTNCQNIRKYKNPNDDCNSIDNTSWGTDRLKDKPRERPHGVCVICETVRNRNWNRNLKNCSKVRQMAATIKLFIFPWNFLKVYCTSFMIIVKYKTQMCSLYKYCNQFGLTTTTTTTLLTIC